MSIEPNRSGAADIAVRVWCLATAAAVLGLLVLFFCSGRAAIAAVVQTGPLSDLRLTCYSVTLSWLLVGLFLFTLRFGRPDPVRVLDLTCLLFIGLLYLNFLRERPVYGDVADYASAAAGLRAGQPLPGRYLYPPFWAMLLEPLVPLGPTAVRDACWLANAAALLLLYALLRRSLSDFGFAAPVASATVTLFLAVNVPLMRTLGYIQTNLHVLNLVLLSLILLRRSPPLSALCLGLAAHLKLSPLVLVIAFLIERNLRWLLWFLLWTALVAGGTVAAHGLGPYRDLLHNLMNVYDASGVCFRENSFDSFIRSLELLCGSKGSPAWPLALSAKAGLAGVALWLAFRSSRGGTFVPAGVPGSAAANALPALLVPMTLASPVVWEHHAVFLALPFLLLLKRLATTSEWLLFGFAYLLEFLLPTFDLFPLSFGRLLAPLVLLWLIWSAGRRQTDSTSFLAATARLQSAISARPPDCYTRGPAP